MDPATAAIVAQALLTYGPPLARELAALLSKKTVTLDDWEVVFALAEKSYAQYVAPKTV